MFRYALMLLAGIVIAKNCSSILGVREWIVIVCCLMGLSLMFDKRHAMVSSVLLLLAMIGVGGMRYSFHDRSTWVVNGDHSCSCEMVIATEPIRRGKVIQFEGIVTKISNSEVSYIGGKDGMRDLLRLSRKRLHVSLLRDTIAKRYEALHIGQSVVADIDMSPLKDWHRMNSNFDYVRWQKMRDIVGRGFIGIGKWEITSAGLSDLGFWEAHKLRSLMLRERLLERIKATGISIDSYAVLTAMAFGNKSALTSDLREEYSMSGASHILALSGMHLSIIYMLLSFFFRRRRIVYRLLIFGGLWWYVIFVGMPLSVVRAALMLTIWEAICLMDREQKSLNVFGATLAVMLMLNPENLWDVGFQMSFMAVFGIIVARPLWDHLIPSGIRRIKRIDEKKLPLWKGRRYRALRVLWYTACISVSAQLGTAPLSAYYFGRVSIYFLLTNFIVIPFATVIICGAFILTAIILADVLAGGMLSVVVKFASAILAAIVTMQNGILGIIAHLPGSSIEGIHFNMLQTASSYVMVYALLLVLYRLVRVR
ncbi:MAG: ComEC/Rec2 family competence protein [Clostridium sp.]|nr:ComEC/Rec2 family competence protein [Clostridium sp.]